MATSLTQTTLSAAVTASATVIPLTSVTGITAGDVFAGTVGSQLYVVDPGQKVGEIMNVQTISGLNVTVQRSGSQTVAHVSGAMVLAGQPQQFYEFDPTGSINGPNTPYVNLLNGNQWLYSSILGCWVAGWGNYEAPTGVTTAVASAAGPITPSGKVFHVTGTAAVTGFTTAVGNAAIFDSFTIIPDGVFTWTTGDGSIAIAGTAVVNKALTFVRDGTNNKWVPSYIA